MSKTFLEVDPAEMEPIESEIRRIRGVLAMRDATCARLCGEAFQDGRKAQERLATIARTHGVDTAVAALEDRTLMGRLALGFLRGGMFRPAERRQAVAATVELVEVIRDIEYLRHALDDLNQARTRLLDQSDVKRIRELSLQRPRRNSRTGSRSNTRSP